jgi:hypothetical protein
MRSVDEERTLHYTAQGFRSRLVEIAPDVGDPYSKRTDIIEKEVRNVISNSRMTI